MEERLDLLVCELAHFHPNELFDWLSNHRPTALALVHLNREFWAERDKWLSEASRILPDVAVQIPGDGDTLRLV